MNLPKRSIRPKECTRIRYASVRFKRLLPLLLITLFTPLFGPQTAYANPGILSTWDSTYPDSSSNNAGCQLCHVGAGGGDPWNAYGWNLRQQIEDNGLSVTAALAAIESMDSDENGNSNIDEINANTQPGWRTGDVNTSYFKDNSTQTNQSPPGGLTLDPAGGETPTATPTDTATPTATPVPSGTPVALENPIPDPIGKGTIIITLTTVVTDMISPLWGTTAPSITNHIYVNDQPGQIWNIDLTTGNKSLFADLSGTLVDVGNAIPNLDFDERGLLGFAFAPDYATSGLVYTYASEPISGTADFSTIPVGVTANHQSVVAEWTVDNPTDPTSTVNPATKRVLLRVDQPQFNHDGGHLVFGPDGMLYIGFGDGGGADDEPDGHGTIGNGQDATNPLGTILRIDPSGNNSANGQYGIPTDNPFVATGDTRLDEIFAYGFRNPFHFSFDSETGELYAGDVGQNDIEEIDLVISGGNYGWRYKEGSFFFNPDGTNPGFVSETFSGTVPSGLIDPIAEYDHDEGLSVIGGFVYRGSALPALTGRYVFADWSTSFGSPEGRLFYLDSSNRIKEFWLPGNAPLGIFVTGFAQDADGELYVLGNKSGTPVVGEDNLKTGVMMKISSASVTALIPEGNGAILYLPVIVNPE